MCLSTLKELDVASLPLPAAPKAPVDVAPIAQQSKITICEYIDLKADGAKGMGKLNMLMCRLIKGLVVRRMDYHAILVRKLVQKHAHDGLSCYGPVDVLVVNPTAESAGKAVHGLVEVQLKLNVNHLRVEKTTDNGGNDRAG